MLNMEETTDFFNEVGEQKIIANNRNEILRKGKRIALLIVLSVILVISCINMASAAFYMKADKIKIHLLYVVMFLFIYLIFNNFCRVKLKINYKILSNRKVNIAIFLTSILILLIMFIGSKLGLKFIPKINGAHGWLNFGGITIQPAEILKIAFIINLANCFSKVENLNLSDKTLILNTLIYLFTYAGLIILQRDTGTAIHYLIIWIGMIFLSKIKLYWIKVGTLLGTIMSGMGLYYISNLNITEKVSYKILRIKSYIDGLLTGEYSNDIGYQVKQSVYAFGSGSLFGKGYANGVQKYSYLPEIHTDFIMATFGEEFGLIGLMLILILFFFLYTIIISVARDSRDYFGKFLASGVGILIITQLIINIFVAVGLFPVFGLPMPFFSYGGSSMLTMAIVISLIDNMIATNYK